MTVIRNDEKCPVSRLNWHALTITITVLLQIDQQGTMLQNYEQNYWFLRGNNIPTACRD